MTGPTRNPVPREGLRLIETEDGRRLMWACPVCRKALSLAGWRERPVGTYPYPSPEDQCGNCRSSNLAWEAWCKGDASVPAPLFAVQSGSRGRWVCPDCYPTLVGYRVAVVVDHPNLPDPKQCSICVLLDRQ